MTRAARAARVVGAAGLVAAVLSSAACSSSTATSGTGRTISTPPTSSAAPVSVPVTSDTPTPTPVPPTTTSAAPSTTAASSTAPATAAAPPVSPSTCRSVGVRVIQGGAERGAEIAALQFTNTGTSSCRLGGFPTVTLMLGGQAVGSPSQPNGSTPRTLTLQPGDTVESLMRDFSTCQAPLSDSARVTVPGETTTAVRPIQLRACTLRVGPLGPPA
ncbi:MAG TPA: DUF4232 domain-containing protein [Jatrophihabitans sp.]|jgi:hypothetical protein|uniref:DUF4232 domain-containing protein n=1 Tax=Jatrophihabitans sp. TaxID=1932789 RepID=UPI002E0B0A96|nr:DUF4232 domain-containing protein [Jatrophihabitans sp.]